MLQVVECNAFESKGLSTSCEFLRKENLEAHYPQKDDLRLNHTLYNWVWKLKTFGLIILIMLSSLLICLIFQLLKN